MLFYFGATRGRPSSARRCASDDCGRAGALRLTAALIATVAIVAVAGCSHSTDAARPSVGMARRSNITVSSTGVSASDRVALAGQPVAKGGGTYKLGRPYQVAGRWYVPAEDPAYDHVGLASWYGADFHGRKTANGEVYDMSALTAAHPTLPLPCLAYVTSLKTGRTILVRVNDRGPYVADRIMDLSRQSAAALGIGGLGVSEVRIRYAGPAPLNGDDRRERHFLAAQPWARQLLAMETAATPRMGLTR